jgi:hypothetical protein
MSHHAEVSNKVGRTGYPLGPSARDPLVALLRS